METGRTRWTDERMDDLALGLREELHELRTEMREGFRDVRAEIAGLRSDTNAGFRAVRFETAELRSDTSAGFRDTNAGFPVVHAEIGRTRRWLAGMWVTTLLGFAGLIVEAGLR
jgi:hypothetical protein